MSGYHMNAEEKVIYELIRERGQVTACELNKTLHMPTQTLKGHLHKLRILGKIERYSYNGSKNITIWQVKGGC